MAELYCKAKRYLFGLTDEEYDRIEPLMLRPARRGRKPLVICARF
jgi:hypothetical protein